MLKQLLILAFSAASPAFAVNISISPYAGTGKVSDGSTVKSATGIRGSIERNFQLGSRFTLGPRLEVGNTYLNTKNSNDGRRVLTTYDNRFLVGGAHSGVLYNLDGKYPNEAYITFCAGRAIAKLNQEESGSDYFAQKQLKDIRGYYYTSEIGTNIQARRDIAFNFALIGNYFNADMSKAKGSMTGEFSNKQGVFKLSADETAKERIPDKLVQKIITLSFGLTVTL